MPHEKPRSVQLEFSNSVPSETPTNDPKTVDREVPFDGYTSAFILGWPNGTGNGVGIGLERASGTNLFPWNKEDEYVAAEDFSHAFDLVVPVEEGETLTAIFSNTDGSNNHFVNAVLTVVEHGRDPQPVSIVDDWSEVPPDERDDGPYRGPR